MDFKKKWQHFWTLNRHHDGGFTLVELIIVIAIMAILAGVAVPAYNGYVEKANEAADNQLLAAVNKAFAAACLQNEFDSVDVSDAGIAMNGQAIKGVAFVKSDKVEIDSSKKASVADAFIHYLEGNETISFKNPKVKSLLWVTDHFVIDTVSLAMSNGTAVMNDAALSAIQGSAFGDMNAEEVKDLLEDNIDSAQSILNLAIWGGQIGDWISGIFGGDGVEFGKEDVIDAVTKGSFKNYFTEEQRDYIVNALSNTSASSAETQKAIDMVSNSMFLYTADVMEGKDMNTLHATIAGTADNSNPRATMENLVSTGGMGGTMVNTAIKSAMYEAFIKENPQYAQYESALTSSDNYNAQTGLFIKTDKYTEDEQAAMKAYDAYLMGEQGKAQLGGFIGALTVVDQNKDAIGQEALIDQGLSNQDLNNLLVEILGSGNAAE